MSSDESELFIAVRDGTEEDRWRIAGEAGHPEDLYRALLEAGEEAVWASLAMNPACPPDVIDAITQRGDDELAAFARMNPNAWPATKDPAPLGSQSTRSVYLYLEARNATLQQRTQFAAAHRASPIPGGQTVGEVWEKIAASS